MGLSSTMAVFVLYSFEKDGNFSSFFFLFFLLGMEREGENVGNKVGPMCIILSYIESSPPHGNLTFSSVFFLFLLFLSIVFVYLFC